MSSLSPDLWARIFDLIGSGCDDGDPFGDEESLSMSTFAQRCQLRLVSRTFNQVFEQWPDLSKHVLVDKKAARQQQRLKSLVAWVQIHAKTIESLKFLVGSSSGQSAVLEALQTLQNAHSALSTVLARCTFVRETKVVNLAPLQALPNLQTLALEDLVKHLVKDKVVDGNSFSKSQAFVGLHLLARLTSLHLLEVIVDSRQNPPVKCLSTLRHLDLLGSEIYGMHSSGLLACEALQVLSCDICRVDAAEQAAFLFDEEIQVPAAMTQLTQLTKLRLIWAWAHESQHPANMRHRHKPVELKWVSQLSNLQDLTLLASGPAWLHQKLTRLSRLTALHIAGDHRNEVASPEWTLTVTWSEFRALQTLTVAHARIVIWGADRLLSLVQVASLRRVTFEACSSLGACSRTYNQLVQLRQLLTDERPDIELTMPDFS